MAIPTGGGTETLKMISTTMGGSYTLEGVSNHIYVILNIIMKNNHSASSAINIEISDDTGSNYQWMVEGQTVAQDATYVWNEKTVLYSTLGRLRVTNTGSDAFHISICYIDQDWT